MYIKKLAFKHLWDVCFCHLCEVSFNLVHDITFISFPISHRVIDGTEVIVETYGKQRGGTGSAATSGSDESQRRSAEQVPVGHRDVITDMGVFQISSSSNALITSSRDGVVKIWK